AEQQVLLQLTELLRLDAHAGELAEAGVDAVHRAAARDRRVDLGAARRDPPLAVLAERDRVAGLTERDEGGERQVRLTQQDLGHPPTDTVPAGSGATLNWRARPAHCRPWPRRSTGTTTARAERAASAPTRS